MKWGKIRSGGQIGGEKDGNLEKKKPKCFNVNRKGVLTRESKPVVQFQERRRIYKKLHEHSSFIGVIWKLLIFKVMEIVGSSFRYAPEDGAVPPHCPDTRADFLLLSFSEEKAWEYSWKTRSVVSSRESTRGLDGREAKESHKQQPKAPSRHHSS